MNQQFWRGKKVFVTGHTGFKGSWLTLWLQSMGAEVKGYALEPPTTPSLFNEASVEQGVESVIGDIRDLELLSTNLKSFKPDVVFHLAAQPLVRLSYDQPIETYETNVMGTVNLLESVRQSGGVRAVVNITSDKCYENKEWPWGYRENEPMGGYDPYSNSKGCAELVSAAYRNSYFNAKQYAEHGTAIATVRAGNVIGGGDWAMDRLIPDLLSAFEKGDTVTIRSPEAIRPWQHVLEPLAGYLLLAEKLYQDGIEYADGWNFGPAEEDAKPVKWIVDRLACQWGKDAEWQVDGGDHPHEAHYLKLDCSKAKMQLGWSPRLDLQHTLELIVSWHKAWLAKSDMRLHSLQEIQHFMDSK
ncbi:MAG: CDP-glucose 4,6-dehydratase [Motiliproteus sp.]|nr:CDP-glucose 4,6-dehydratase [Motiliproteus sp.]MCW9053455.1 CDP-glucose 4,6-dehydratase [Motiliproteus sp.]